MLDTVYDLLTKTSRTGDEFLRRLPGNLPVLAASGLIGPWRLTPVSAGPPMSSPALTPSSNVIVSSLRVLSYDRPLVRRQATQSKNITSWISICNTDFSLDLSRELSLG